MRRSARFVFVFIAVFIFFVEGIPYAQQNAATFQTGLDRSFYVGPLWANISNPIFRERSMDEMIKLEESQSGWGFKGGVFFPIEILIISAFELDIMYVSTKFNDFYVQVGESYYTKELFYNCLVVSLLDSYVDYYCNYFINIIFFDL